MHSHCLAQEAFCFLELSVPMSLCLCKVPMSERASTELVRGNEKTHLTVKKVKTSRPSCSKPY